MKSKKFNISVFGILLLNCLFILTCTSGLQAVVLPKTAIQFTENKGQWPSNILFKADIPIGNLFIEKGGLTYLFVDKEATHEMQHGKKINSLQFHAVKVKFEQANPYPQIEKDQKSEEYYNYFVGESSRWASNVYAYKRVVLKNIYPQTDLEILAQGEGIKINFLLQAGADPNRIELSYEGATEMLLNQDQLKIKTSMGELLEDKPVSYQQYGNQIQTIPTQFVLNQNKIRFSLNTYNKQKPITIDPNVVFGTYMGSAADNFGFAASYDDNGNAYGAGTVYAANFPFTAGAFDISFNGGNSNNGEYARDAFIAKFNPTGTSLLFGTFIGGTDNEQPHSVTIKNGEIIVFGTTHSADFPVSNSSYDKTYNGGADLFVLKLNSTGSSLLASTYIGGSQDDGINGEAHQGFTGQFHSLPYNYADWFRGEVITDLLGNIYVSSCTKSAHNQGLPLVNASQAIFGGGDQDGYLVKLNSSLSLIQFSTYIGGSGDESAYSICVNNLNELIVGGGTTSSTLQFGSTTFPYSGGVDGFVAKFSSSGAKIKLIYTGTSTYDQIFFVQTDDQNNIYTLGQTKGTMPVSPGTYGVNNSRQFLQKYNPSLSTLMLSTTFGKAGSNEPSISPAAFLVDICGRVYISGWGGATNQSYHNGMDNVFGMVTTADAFQKTTDGSDFYLMVLSPNFGNLLYASFYGGIQSQEHVDGGTSHFDKSGIVYQAVCAGCGGLNDFPTTPNAYSRVNPGKRAFNTNIGGCNLGLFKFDMRTYIKPLVFRDTTLIVTAGQNLSYSFNSVNPGVVQVSGSIFLKAGNPATTTTITADPLTLTTTINWKSLCSDFPSDTFFVDVFIQDDACPVKNEIRGIIKIVIKSDSIPPPFPECLKIINDSVIQLSWINVSPNSDFQQYHLYRYAGSALSVLYDSISLQNTSKYNDVKAFNNLDTNYCFEIHTLNSCRLPGPWSRKICSLNKLDTGTFFTGTETEMVTLHAFDTFQKNYAILSVDPKDSVFLKAGGSFVEQGKGTQVVFNGLGIASVNVRWIPDCSDIYSDTLTLFLSVHDNVCPNSRQAGKIIRFFVIPPEPASPPISYCPKKISKDSVFVEWPTFQKKPFSKELFLFRSVNGISTLIATFTDLNTNSYIDHFTFDIDKTTCYQLSSSVVCDYQGDTGTAVCIQNNSNPTPNLTLYTATVVNDKEVHFVWQKADADSFWRYQVMKRTGRFGSSYEMVKEFRNLQDTVFIDEDVKVDENSYCYQLLNIDLCGNINQFRKEACTILLTGTSVPFENHMNWLPYDYWDQGINRYEILKTEPGLYTDNFFGTTGEKPLLATDNKLNYDNGLYQYSVVAYENLFANKQSSRSNTIDLIQAPLLYAPNAFTDNGDGLNDWFHTVPVFVKDYYLQVYNRWGDRIFETHNKKDGFSGLYISKETQEDVYFYIVNYTGWDGSVNTKKGNFTLLR